MHSYHALAHVCVGSCVCHAQATPLSKLGTALIPYFCAAITEVGGGYWLRNHLLWRTRTPHPRTVQCIITHSSPRITWSQGILHLTKIPLSLKIPRVGSTCRLCTEMSQLPARVPHVRRSMRMARA